MVIPIPIGLIIIIMIIAINVVMTVRKTYLHQYAITAELKVICLQTVS